MSRRSRNTRRTRHSIRTRGRGIIGVPPHAGPPKYSSVVFEIGQQLASSVAGAASLADGEDATKIRAKFLAALEDDHLDTLPDPAYGRIFLRDYARSSGSTPTRW